MASPSTALVARSSVSFTGRGGFLDRYFYFAMSLVTAGLVMWGFGHTADEYLFHAKVPRPLLLWCHAAAFSSWIILFIVQSGLVRTHHVRWHRTLGWGVAGLGAVMVPLGVSTALVMGHFDTVTLGQTDADLFQFVSFYDMAVFAVWLALGILWRRKPELHRRALMIATCGLVGAAFGRIPYLFDHHLFYVGVDALICLGVVRDLLVNGRVHRLYLIGLPVMAVAQFYVVHVITTPPQWWAHVAHRLMG